MRTKETASLVSETQASCDPFTSETPLFCQPISQGLTQEDFMYWDSSPGTGLLTPGSPSFWSWWQCPKRTRGPGQVSSLRVVLSGWDRAVGLPQGQMNRKGQILDDLLVPRTPCGLVLDKEFETPCYLSTVPQSTPLCEAWVLCTGARASWKLHIHWKIVPAVTASRWASMVGEGE